MTRKGFWRAACAALLGGAAIIAGALHRPGVMQPNSERTKQAVLARIPLGSGIPDALAIMQTEGFKCAAMHSRFSDDRAGSGPQATFPAADIVWCDSGERSTWALLITKRWQVTFVNEAGRVARVAVGVGLTGP